MGRLGPQELGRLISQHSTAEVRGAQRRPLHLPDASRELPSFLRTLKPGVWQATVGNAKDPEGP